MENIKDIYQNLTQVNIDEQRRLWDDRGKGYWGEFLVFNELYLRIDSNCKFLMNLNIPTKNGKTTEIDLLMFHETGIYVFEIKHYKGIIYGDEHGEIWTQYFKTQKNKTFKNPISQNAYHIKALKDLFPNVEIHSIIVFSNEHCSLKINNTNQNISICSLSDLRWKLQSTFRTQEAKYSLDEIEKQFEILSKYSPLTEEQITEDGTIIPFYDYIHKIKSNYTIEVNTIKNNFIIAENNLKSNYIKKEKRIKRTKLITIIFSIASILLCFLFAIAFCFSYQQECDRHVKEAENERVLMEQNFQRVDETNIPYNDIINDCSTVNCTLKNSKIKNTVQLQGNIELLTDNYGIRLNENSKYIVLKDDGTSYQYDIFNSNNPYNSFSNTIHPNGHYSSGKLRDFNFNNIGNVKNITYIKITNVTLFDATNYPYPSYADNLELEIYSVG